MVHELFLKPVKITEVTAVGDDNANITTLPITGRNFSYSHTLKVTLDEFGALTIEGVLTDTQIVATESRTIAPGDSLLKVSKGKFRTKGIRMT